MSRNAIRRGRIRIDARTRTCAVCVVYWLSGLDARGLHCPGSTSRFHEVFPGRKTCCR